MSIRWQPTRAGLCNVWRYADEVLTFHRGRLLLRGANGSGKSMALELLLPFLLDANARPERITSGTRSRGGLYERLITGAEGAAPVGFLWVEFAAGVDTFTIGARLRTSASAHRVEIAWFTTTHVIGRDLHLLDDQRVPLSLQALKEAVGPEHVHEVADEYRRAVRTTLFPGFDERQYDAVITTLLALRREKISQDLSPAKLSEILTESLPPLDEYRLREVAEGFERLDRRRDAIDRLEVDLAEMQRLGRRHRQYARLALAAVVNRVRAAATERDKVTRDEKAAVTAFESGQNELRAVEDERASGRQTAGRLAAEVTALRDRDAYKEGNRLTALQGEAERSDRRAENESARSVEVEAAAAASEDQARRAIEGQAVAAGNQARATREAETAARDADGAAVFGEAVALEADEAERLLAAWDTAREEAVRAVAVAVRDHGKAMDERTRREDAVDREREELDDASTIQRRASQRLADERAQYGGAVLEWARSCVELGDAAAVVGALPAPPDVPDDVITSVTALATSVREERAVARAQLVDDIRDIDARAAELTTERDDIARGHITWPAAPGWRSPDAREGRAGAPLWLLVDVVAGTSEGDVDGIEAALVASGLLDAWVTPDGRVDLGTDLPADAFVDGGVATSSVSVTLAAVLSPADLDDAPAASDVVARVLDAVGLVDGYADLQPAGTGPVVARDGSFRIDPIVGRGDVVPASFVGAAAREQQRLRRLAVIEHELAELGRERAAVERAVEAIERRVAVLAAELDALPSGASIAVSVRELDVASARVADGERRVEAATAARIAAEEQARAAQRRLAQLASEHRLPTEELALDDYRARLRRLRDVAQAWLGRRRESARARIDVERTALEATRSRGLAIAAKQAAERAADEADQLRVQLDVLEATVGSEYREIAARIASAEQERRELEANDHTLETRQLHLTRELGKLEQQLDEIAERRVRADAQRDGAHAAFVSAVSDGLLGDSAVEVVIDPAALVGVTAVLEAARATGAAIGDLDASDAVVSKAQQGLGEAIHQAKQTLSSAVELSFDQAHGGWWLLRAVGGGLRRTVAELTAGIAADVATSADELRSDEQRLFEETLSGDVRSAVADRLRRATSLIDGINRELGKVRTEAAGVGVRLKWEVDPDQPDAVRSARRLLLRDAADWNDEERTSMFAFFRARLDEARAALDGTAGWDARLREALDYRHWHRFTLEIAHRDWEGLQPATDRRLARLSTGERSIALHLPMLASVAAHYDGASFDGGSSSDTDERPGCPRLILLDELFAGVDVVNRAQLFGMFVTWDLDAVFTSDHEWCAYASLDGIAIHHLHAADGADPVTTARFVWDGRTRVAAPLELVPA